MLRRYLVLAVFLATVLDFSFFRFRWVADFIFFISHDLAFSKFRMCLIIFFSWKTVFSDALTVSRI